jgi:hypothetical protein
MSITEQNKVESKVENKVEPKAENQAQPELKGVTVVINNSNVNADNNASDASTSVSSKSKVTTAILTVLLGELGIHRFYVGKIGTGLIYLFTCGIFGIGWIVDMILVFTNKFTDKDGKYITK